MSNTSTDDEDDGTIFRETPTLEEIEKFRPKARNDMLISGWDDQDENIEVERNPHETPEKEILWAAESGELEVVEDLLKKHPHLINTRDKDNYTPLHRQDYFIKQRTVIILMWLMHTTTAGADPNAETEMKWTPLHSACKWNNASVAGLLLQYGANVNAQSNGGQTPLHVASSSSDCREVLTILLLTEGIKPNILNSSNETAFDIAKRSGKYYYLFDIAHDALNDEDLY
ncbi:ankyrin repeat domain-containing protein 49-like [Ctenocephalides felis]|uniref:ankyrin repeat domain-containing protein 49-like n=1 Tax=Ctenocephalides felis TaxID=7515 RepID=UPI000E6E56AE|nr:ankyrin repeat domain-containing protein 49-like [Ctenocephalides felis]